MDCKIKLLKHILPDLTRKNHLYRIKAEAIVFNVLGKKAIDDVQHLINNNVFYAIQIDASNVKNRIFFPITVQYFNEENSIVNRIIYFLENPNETAIGMFGTIDETLRELKLSFDNISSLSADNCNTNFGKNHSLYTELK